ncbi:MAG: BTAD domain-containing putative transcriptional regulator [Nocardioidaceae bacterium]
MSRVLVRVLGAVELVTSEGEVVALPGSRQPALLAALAARANEVVSSDRLVHLLWGDDLPVNPEAALHSAVFKLRASLRSVSGREVLRTRDRAYQLLLKPGDLDADVFLDLVREARDRPPAVATAALNDALKLWRGPAYAGFSDTDIAHLEALRLEEARRAAVEGLARALLAADRPDEAVVLLEPFVDQHPLREEARTTLMRALHRLGRTGDALEHYQRHRTTLADELGLEPSQAMQDLQVELLQQPSPSTAPQSAAHISAGASSTAGSLTAVRPRGLPGLQVHYLRTGRGNTLAYGTTGSGPPLVVILGWLSSLDVIASGRDPRSSLLERLAGDLSLTLFDRHGTGLSPGPVADYGIEPSVAEVLDVIETVGPPVSLLAMSAAGPIAVSAAARKPDWVSALVLFGTFANGQVTFTDKAMRDMVVDIARSHWGIGSKLLADLYRPGSSDEAAWHLARVFRESASPDVAADYLAAIYDQDVTSLLPTVRAPALVLHYRGDRLIPFRGGQDLASGLPNATLLPLDGRVHLPDAADLDQIEQAIVDHVRRHG